MFYLLFGCLGTFLGVLIASLIGVAGFTVLTLWVEIDGKTSVQIAAVVMGGGALAGLVFGLIFACKLDH